MLRLRGLLRSLDGASCVQRRVLYGLLSIRTFLQSPQRVLRKVQGCLLNLNLVSLQSILISDCSYARDRMQLTRSVRGRCAPLALLLEQT